MASTLGPTTIADARGLFPGASECIYLDVAARGLLPAATRAAIETQVDQQTRGAIDKTQWFATLERVREALARLIGAQPCDLAYTKNISEGINAVACAIDWRPGDNVVLCPDLEHPSNVYPWLNLNKRHGVEIRALPARDGIMPVAAMIAAMDLRTRVVTASAVSFAPGLRTDLSALGRACRGADALFLVDAAQAIGVTHLDMTTMPVDVLALSTQKGLCALYGMGLMYVRRSWAERLSPVYLSRFGVDLGDAHELAMDFDRLRLMPDARRFEVGNYNYLGAAALEPALAILNAVGTAAIERHNHALAERLAQGLRAAALPVFGTEAQRAHIVAVGAAIGDAHDAAGAEMTALYDHLAGAGVRLSIRRGILRMALHLYNTAADVDRVIDLAAQWKRAPRGARRPEP